ncbi:MAG: NAD+ synthase, partial [Mariprofundales bacterium]|nr:NAD+ synthase [Mariprofundales bacterium]
MTEVIATTATPLSTLRIMTAQCTPRVGDISGNLSLAERAVAQADSDGCQLAILPELLITGYPPEDLLLRRDFLKAAEQATQQLISSSGEVAILFGHPTATSNGITNSASLAWRGRLIGSYHKRALPNYGVFDERRYFTPGAPDQLPVHWQGLRLHIAICEDIWDDNTSATMAQNPCDIVISINSSPFQLEKQQLREQLLQQRARQLKAPLLYVNSVGGQDELVFDGGSCLHQADGTLSARLPMFSSKLEAISCHGSNHITPTPSATEQLHQALTTGVRDYLHRNHYQQVVLGISGGIDSALCATIACDAIGADNVLGVLLPSRYSSDHSISDSRELASNLGIATIELPITSGVDAVDELLQPVWQQWNYSGSDITEENLQARMRGLLLMAIANKTGRMLLTTGNKSEMAVGYATLYGDMAGGFAPLKDLYKTDVYRLAKALNRQQERIPIDSITKPPSAELRPNQQDSDS